MATKKKPATRKKTTTKAANTRKRTATKKKQSDFWAIEFTLETLYWLIFGILVVAIGIWTYTTSQQVSEIYDNMNADDTTIIESSKPE